MCKDSLIIVVIKRIKRQQGCVIEVHVNTPNHKYYMFMYGFQILSISVYDLKKNCIRDKRELMNIQ